MEINLTQIILAVIALLSAIITGYVIPFLRSKIEGENSRLTESQRMLLQTAVRTAVFAAEQIYGSEQGAQKKSYVLALLEQQGYQIDSAAIDAAIEAMVKELKIELNKQ